MVEYFDFKGWANSWVMKVFYEYDAMYECPLEYEPCAHLILSHSIETMSMKHTSYVL